MKAWIASALVVSTLASCTPTTTEFRAHLATPDQFQPDRVSYFSDGIDIRPVQFGVIGFTFFKLYYAKTSASEMWYIQTDFRASDWLFVESVLFNVDGNIFEFPSLPSPKRETGTLVGEVVVLETNRFELTDEFLDALRGARTVAIRLAGEHYKIDRNLTPEDIKNMNWFVTYVRERLKPAA